MAVYKVPQDVEAEDKLLGPFSFRQFVYLMIAGGAGFITWLLWSLSPFLIVIPMPFIIFFVVLALPLRKDQPMEIYLLAVVQFLLKPKKRLWRPDGIITLVQITLPQVSQVQRSKDLTESEAVDRLSYLAQVMDTRGWASRGIEQPIVNNAITDAAAVEAQGAEDVLDASTSISQNFDSLIQQRDTARRQDMLARMQNQDSQPAQSAVPPPSTTNPYDQFASTPQSEDTLEAQESALPQNRDADDPTIEYNPYPTSIRQQVIQPLNRRKAPPVVNVSADSPPENDQSASEIQVSPDIISLANNPDLNISTIAREAKRIQEREESDGEVVIPLR